MDESKTTTEESKKTTDEFPKKNLTYQKLDFFKLGNLQDAGTGATNVSVSHPRIVSSSKTEGKIRLRFAPKEEEIEQDTSTE
jgi:hypothetical protein